MKHLAAIGFFIFLVYGTSAQNLITNGGFESGTTNWSGWWSRDNKGSATVRSGKRFLLTDIQIRRQPDY